MILSRHFCGLFITSALSACATAPLPPAPPEVSSLSAAPDAATLVNFTTDRRNFLSLLDNGPCEKQADGSHKRRTYSTRLFPPEGSGYATQARVKPNVPLTLSYFSEMSSSSCGITAVTLLLPGRRYQVLTNPVGNGPCSLQIVDSATQQPAPLFPGTARYGEHACTPPQ
jgi:hypothetical protein